MRPFGSFGCARRVGAGSRAGATSAASGSAFAASRMRLCSVRGTPIADAPRWQRRQGPSRLDPRVARCCPRRAPAARACQRANGAGRLRVIGRVGTRAWRHSAAPRPRHSPGRVGSGACRLGAARPRPRRWRRLRVFCARCAPSAVPVRPSPPSLRPRAARSRTGGAPLRAPRAPAPRSCPRRPRAGARAAGCRARPRCRARTRRAPGRAAQRVDVNSARSRGAALAHRAMELPLII